MVDPSCHCARLFPNHYCIDLQLEYYPRWKTPSTPRPRPNRSRPIISSLLLQCAHATRTEDVACRLCFGLALFVLFSIVLSVHFSLHFGSVLSHILFIIPRDRRTQLGDRKPRDPYIAHALRSRFSKSVAIDWNPRGPQMLGLH